MFFAFSNEQLVEGLKKLGLTLADTSKITSIGAGGYMLKDRVETFKKMLADFDKDMKQLRKDRKELLEALKYELMNHEYCITYDPTEALNKLGLTIETVDQDILKQAKKAALQDQYV
jgi:hypothetical protein